MSTPTEIRARSQRVPTRPERQPGPDDPRPATLASSPFVGLLWPTGEAREPSADPPEFHDLHLDDIVAAVLSGRESYGLEPAYRARAEDLDTIAFRHEVFRDLGRPEIRQAVDAFSAAMRDVRADLDRRRRAHYRYEQVRWHLAAAERYAVAVSALHEALVAAAPASRALAAMVGHLDRYVGSEAFRGLATDARRITDDMAAVRFRLRLEIGKLSVSAPADEPDFGAELLAAFERFKQGAGREYTFEFAASPDLHHVEDAIVERVALVYPALFAELAAFVARQAEFIEPGVARFDREAQFYLVWLKHTARIGRLGVSFSLPHVAVDGGELVGAGLFDLALAGTIARERGRIVTNEIDLRPGERIVVVTGPNQGGKSTFARMLGQLHHLAALGVPVPGTGVRLDLVDGIHALFERQEVVEDLVSKLEEDLRRIRAILEVITPRSLVVMNETFSSTTVADQGFINERVLSQIEARGSWCVIVTFLDELAARGASTVSMVSEVDPGDTARRTFRVRRRPADGMAYALAVAEKHGLTATQIQRRLAR